MPRIAFHTHGCKVNQGETAAMAHLFREAGYEVVDFDQVADVYIINSCAVTIQAEQKSRQSTRRAREHNPNAIVVMVGCYPQVAQDREALLADVDLLVGSAEKQQIVDLVEQARQVQKPLVAVSDWAEQTQFEVISSRQDSDRTRATLKVQDGCQQFCAYCIIPYARGPERSRPLASIMAEARDLVEEGFLEIVLTGIHLGSYGRDLPGQIGLTDLVESVLQVPGLRRLRLSSVEPNEIDKPLLELMQQYPNFCRHLHIPLQAGNDRILRAMRRRYQTDDYRQVIELVRSHVPEAAISTDIIVGFPGETEADFAATYEFVQDMAFSRLHVFRYSRRPGTPAADFPAQVAGREKAKRSRALISLGKSMARDYARRLLHTEQEVLWENKVQNCWMGHTDTYVKVYSDNADLHSNLITRVPIKQLWRDGVWA